MNVSLQIFSNSSRVVTHRTRSLILSHSVGIWLLTVTLQCRSLRMLFSRLLIHSVAMLFLQQPWCRQKFLCSSLWRTQAGGVECCDYRFTVMCGAWKTMGEKSVTGLALLGFVRCVRALGVWPADRTRVNCAVNACQFGNFCLRISLLHSCLYQIVVTRFI